MLGYAKDYTSRPGYCAISGMNFANRRANLVFNMNDEHIGVKKSDNNLAAKIDTSKLTPEQIMQVQMGHMKNLK